jgi:hypothetical protein
VINATFNNISVISWRSVLLVEDTGVTAENHRPVANYWQTLSHYVVSSTPRHELCANWFFTILRELVLQYTHGFSWMFRRLYTGVRIMVFNATFNNISGITWRSVLLMGEPGETHWPVTSHWQTLPHNVVSSILRRPPDSNSQLYWW